MSKKPLNRREFMAAAGLLLGSAGVSALVQNDLLKKITNELFPQAHADVGNAVDFMIEICGRDGAPLIYLGTGAEFVQGGGNNYPNVPMQQISDMQMKGGQNGARPLYMNGVAGGANSVANLLGPHANNIAISQGFNANGLGHTPLFGHREGQKEMGLTTPIIEFADRAKKAPGFYQALVVHGVNWNRRNMTNQTNGLQDLTDVNGADQFRNLFRKPVLRLSQQEVEKVAEASRQLSSLQAQKLQSRIQNISTVVENHSKGAELLTLDYTALLDVAGMDTNFMIGQSFTNGGRNWGDLGSALAYTCKAFQHGLISASTVTYDSGDWHGFQALSNTSYQANAGVYMSRILSATIAFLKATPHPYRTGESLWDRTLIQMSSEFTRSISMVNQDNSDGGTTGFLLAGGKIKGGYYGSFDLSGGGGRAYGFDPISGAPQTGMRNNTGSLYNTVNALLGNKTKVAADQPLACLMRA